MKLLITTFIMLGLLAGCDCNKLREGEVYEKEFKPRHIQTLLMPVCISNGKSTTTVLMPYIIIYPDRWRVCIRAFDGKQWKSTSYYVPPEVYNAVKVGDQFVYEKGRDLDKEPYTKTRQK